MSVSRWRRRRAPIGVELGGRSIHAVQAVASGGAVHVEAACSIARSAPDEPIGPEEIARFANVLERQGFHGQKIVLAVPPAHLLTAQLEMDARGGDLGARAHCELAAAHQAAPERLVSACWRVPMARHEPGGERVLAVGCAQDAAEALLDAFEGADLTVAAIDIESLAIVRACASRLGSGLSAALSLGWRAVSLVVIFDRVVVYERALAEAGFSRLGDALRREMDLDSDVTEHVLTEIGVAPPAEHEATPREFAVAVRERILAWANALIPEIRLSLGYASQEYGRDAVEGILMVGEGADMPGLAQHLHQELGIAAAAVTPADVATCDAAAAAACARPAMTTALGLSLYKGTCG